MKRVATATAVALVGMLAFAASASAVAPSLGPVSATNIQGVSAVLKGTVDPEGLSTTYSFEYSTQASFAGSKKTGSASAGSGSSPMPARAFISGLSSNTTYHFRLVATNATGTTTGGAQSLTTTKGFGFLNGTEGFSVNAIADGGGGASLAGSHPYQVDFTVALNQGGEFEGQPGVTFSDGDIRSLQIEAPPGFLANPSVLPGCTLIQFNSPRFSPYEASRSGESCPDNTQVGTVEIATSRGGGQTLRFGVFNLVPPPGVPARLGFSPFGSGVTIDVNLRPVGDGSYALAFDAINIPQSLDLYGIKLSLWGTPWAASHDRERGNCLNAANPDFAWSKCSVGDPTDNLPRAYLTLPSRCAGPLSFKAAASSWQQPATVTTSAVNRTLAGQPVDLDGCVGLPFKPQAVGQLNNVNASSPSGYSFRLTSDQANLTDPEQRSPAPTKKAVITLPPGVTINPSVGAGLDVCRPAQYAAERAGSRQGEGCPNASKIGSFQVRTSLFRELLQGAIYLAQPNDPATGAPGAENPFDSLVALYLIARHPDRGILIKVPGRVDPNPGTGQLTATFDGLPQLPYTELDITFHGEQRTFLVTPSACGPATTRMELTPWAGPLSVGSTTDSQIAKGIGGGPCPEGTPPFAPTVVAGGVNSNVNSYTPYFVHITRRDTEQEITSYALKLPKGITGKLAGIPFCPDSAIEAARAMRGFAETVNPSCPKASEVGHTLSGYGVGSALTYATGRIYLAGPYRGQPLSLVAINPATVGPFDLGTIVIRSAFSVDPRTAQLQIDASASDPIPHILAGIPLHLRDIRIYMDRPQFTHNPSSCVPSELVSSIGGSGADFSTTADDTVATGTRFFQLLNCKTLGFRPTLRVKLRGGTKRRAYPEMTVTFKSRGARDTNLKEIMVSMPRSQFFAQEHITGICSRVQFNAENCPKGSIYGRATAYTPLFDEPLRGPVYLRSSGKQIPDLVASLRSGAVRIILEGEIGGTKQGGVRARFRELPDEPVNRFVMVLYGGKRGLLQNSSDICAEPPLATVKALGQNNLGAEFTSTLRGQCAKKKSKRNKGGGR